MIALLQQYLLCLAFLLIVAYLLPAGLLHWLVSVRPTPAIAAARIQARRPGAEDVAREVRHSLGALLLFALYAVPLLNAYEAGWTSVYWDIGAWPLWWLPASVIAAAVLHDTWFYWTHRLMHTRTLFAMMHAGHHRSITPTPWAILSFGALETIPQFAFFALLILLVPMHPAALLAYLVLDGIVNAAGHSGHEVVPRAVREHRLARYLNAVVHHDLHHTRFRCNYGQYFNVWDRAMGTFRDGRPLGEHDQTAATTGTPSPEGPGRD